MLPSPPPSPSMTAVAEGEARKAAAASARRWASRARKVRMGFSRTHASTIPMPAALGCRPASVAWTGSVAFVPSFTLSDWQHAAREFPPPPRRNTRNGTVPSACLLLRAFLVAIFFKRRFYHFRLYLINIV